MNPIQNSSLSSVEQPKFLKIFLKFVSVGFFIVLSALLFNFNAQKAEAAACNATASGTWGGASDTASFTSCTGAAANGTGTGNRPASTDTVTINAGVALTLAGNVQVAGVTIAANTVTTVALTLTGFTLTNTGTLVCTLPGGNNTTTTIAIATGTLSSTGLITLNAGATSRVCAMTQTSGTLTLGNGITFTGATPTYTMNTSSGVINLNGGTFGSGGTVTFTTTPTLNIGGTSTFNQAKTVAALNVNTGTLTYGAAVTVTGATTIADGATLKLGAFAATFTGAVTIGSGGAGGSLTCPSAASCTGTKTFSANITVNANSVFNLDIGSTDPTIVSFSGTSISHSGTTFNTGTGTTVTIAGTGALAFAGSSNMTFGNSASSIMTIPTNRALTNNKSGGTLNIGALTFATPTAANSFTLNNGTTTAVTGAITFNANTTANAQTLTLGNGASGAANLSARGIIMNAPTSSGASKITCFASPTQTGTLSILGANTIAITGNSTSTGIASIDMSPGACSVTSGTIAGTVVTLTGGSNATGGPALLKMGIGTLTLNGNLAFGGANAGKSQLNMSANGGTLVLNGGTLPVVGTSGAYTISASTHLTSTGTSNVNYATAVSAWGNLNVSSGTLAFAAAENFTNMTIADTATLSAGANLITNTGNLTCGSGGSATISGSAGLTLSGASSTISGGTCNITNTGTVLVTGVTAPTVTSGATVVLSGALQVNTSLTNSGTVTANVGLSGVGNFINSAGGILNIGFATAPTISTLTATGTTPDNVVNYTAATPICKVTAYDDLTFSGSGTVTCAVTTIADQLNLSTATSLDFTTGATLVVGGLTTVGSGATLAQGGTFNFTTGGLTTSGTGIFTNISTGDLTLGGDVNNAGTITLNSNNGGLCVDGANDILIRSTVSNTLRAWSGAGTFTLRNLDVDDMTGTISAEKSVFSGDTTWTEECVIPVTTLGNGTDGGNGTIAPGASATEIDRFSLATNTGTDTVTGMTVTLAGNASAYENIATVDVQTTAGVSKFLATPSSNTVVLNSSVVADGYVEANQDSAQQGSSVTGGSGQSFLGDGKTLDSAKFYLKKSGTPTGTYSAKIYAISGSLGTTSIPTGAVLATSDPFDVSTLTTSFNLINFNFSGANRITLTNLGSYALVLSTPSESGSDHIIFGIDASSPLHIGNSMQIDEATNWAPGATKDLIFYVNTVPDGSGIDVTTTPTEYKIMITPKSPTAMPAIPGASYATTATVTSITASNTISGTDSGSATITVDNASPAGVTSATATAGNALVNLAWTNPADSDFTTSGTTVVLRNTAAITDAPIEGVSYSASNLASAGTADTYNESNQDGGRSLGFAYTASGQAFTGDGKKLVNAKFYLKKDGFPTGNIGYAKLYATTGTYGTTAVGTGAALATSDAFDISTLTTNYQLTTLPFSGANQVVLGSGTKYVIVFEAGGTGEVNFVTVGRDDSSPTHSGNNVDFDGVSWYASSTRDTIFYVSTLSAGSTVACVITGSAPATSCSDTGLANGTAYNYKIFTRDSRGNYSDGVTPTGSPATPFTNTTTIGNGTDGGNSTIGPGASATEIDRFSLVTSAGTDTVTGMTVTLSGTASVYANIATVSIQASGGGANLCSKNVSTANTVTLTSCGIAVNTTPAEYKIMITPKSHIAMPVVPGNSYATTATVTAITATNSTAGADSGSATITVDNGSPAGVTSSTATAGDTVVDLAWTNPADSDFTTGGTVVAFRSTSAITTAPVEGTTYTVGNTIGGSSAIADSYSEANSDGASSMGLSIGLAAQSFTGDGGTLDSAKFYLSKIGTPSGYGIVAQIYAHSGTFGASSATGALLATSDSIDISALTNSLALVNFNFSGVNKINLTAGARYVVAVFYSTGVASNLSVGVDGSSPTHAGSFYNDDSGPIPSLDLIFYVYTTINLTNVACVVTGTPPATSCQDTGLANGTPYHYKIFTKDSNGNYNAGTVPTGSPVTPAAAPAGITISGNVYADEFATTTSQWAGCGAVANVGISINGGAKSTTTCALATGAFAFTNKVVSANDIITVFLDTNGGDKGVTYTRALDGATDLTGLSLIRNTTSLRYEAGSSITNANINTYDKTNDADIPVASDGTNVVGDAGIELHIDPSMNYSPGGTVYVNNMHVKGTFTGSSQTVTINNGLWIDASGTFIAPTNLALTGNLINDGTFTHNSGTVNMNLGGTFQISRPIILDHTQVVNSTQTNFPVMIAGTFDGTSGKPNLKNTTNGGPVLSANGYDVAFFSDPNLTMRLRHEVEKYDGATGDVVYWVRIPVLSTATDTIIYMAYRNAAINSDQSDPKNVWSNGYDGVWHLPDGAELTANDSTKNGKTGSPVGNTTAVSGKIGGAASFDGSGDSIDMGSVSSKANDFTVEFWLNDRDTSATRGMVFFNGSGANGYGIAAGSSDGGSSTAFNFLAQSVYWQSTNIPWTQNTWTHIVATLDATNVWRFYKNGAIAYTSGVKPAITTPTGSTILGNESSGGSNSTIHYLDEVRVSNSVRSANWIATEYNNQNSPSTFYTFGTEVGSGTVTTIAGANNIAFNNFTVSSNNGGGKSLKFKSSGAYSFAGAFTAHGQAGNILSIASTIPTSPWVATFNGTAVINYASIRDSACSGGNTMTSTYTTINLGSNGNCFVFKGLGAGTNLESNTAASGGVTGGGISGGGVLAKAISVLTNNSVSSVVVQAGGFYENTPTVSFCGGGGNGASGTANLTNNAVTSVTVNSGGTSYTTPPGVLFNSNCPNTGGGASGGASGDSGFLYDGTNYAAVGAVDIGEGNWGKYILGLVALMGLGLVLRRSKIIA